MLLWGCCVCVCVRVVVNTNVVQTSKSFSKNLLLLKERNPMSDRSKNQFKANIKHPGDWTCPLCNVNVFASRDKCFRCYTKRPKKIPKETRIVNERNTSFGKLKKLWTILTVSYAAYRLVRYLLPIMRRKNIFPRMISFLKRPPTLVVFLEHIAVITLLSRKLYSWSFSMGKASNILQSIRRHIVLPNPIKTVGRNLKIMRHRKNTKPRRPRGFKAFTWRGKTDLNFVEAWGPQKLLSYSKAKSYLYGFVDNINDTVTGVYTGDTMTIPRAKDLKDRKRLRAASSLAYDSGQGINCERTCFFFYV